MKKLLANNIKEVTEEVEQPKLTVTLMNMLDDFLDSKEQSGTKKITGFHPSYGYACKRRWVLLFQGAEYESKFPPRTQRIFDNGHSVHDRWRNYFKEMGILVEAEVPVKTEDPPIRGHADGILDLGEKILYELKSISPTRFEFRRVYNKPDDKTYGQAQMYLNGLDLDRGIVIYENKGTQEVLMFAIERDEKLIEKEMRRYKKIYEIFQEGKTPARPYKRDSKNCMDCDLEKFCWDQLDD